MQTFNPTGTADLEVLFYLSDCRKWHLLVGRRWCEQQSNGVRREENDPGGKGKARNCEVQARGEKGTYMNEGSSDC